MKAGQCLGLLVRSAGFGPCGLNRAKARTTNPGTETLPKAMLL
jgi:hypothetical protein